MVVSSALTGLAQVIVMNRDDTMAVDTSVGVDGVFLKTTLPAGAEIDASFPVTCFCSFPVTWVGCCCVG